MCVDTLLEHCCARRPESLLEPYLCSHVWFHFDLDELIHVFLSTCVGSPGLPLETEAAHYDA